MNLSSSVLSNKSWICTVPECALSGETYCEARSRCQSKRTGNPAHLDRTRSPDETLLQRLDEMKVEFSDYCYDFSTDVLHILQVPIARITCYYVWLNIQLGGLADQTVFFIIKVIISSSCLWELLIQPRYGVCLSYSEHHIWISFQTPDGQQVFTLTCWQVGRWSAAWLIAMIFPAGLVRCPHGTAVSLALFHCPGAGLPFTFHQCLTPTHLLQEAFFNVLWLYPGLFLLPGGGSDYKICNVTLTNKVVKSLELGKKIKWASAGDRQK